jgi:hypothetical protein
VKNFELVDTDGLTGLFHKGRLIPFDKIDDTMAETLIGKTHVLKRIGAEPTPAVAVAQLAPASEPAAAEAEAPATGRRRAGS